MPNFGSRENKNIGWFLTALFLALIGGFLAGYFNLLGLAIVCGLCFFILACLFIFNEPFYGVMLITFFLPFERIGTLEVSSFTLKINHLFGLITIVAWFLTMLIKKEVRFKKMPIIVPLLLFLLINLLSFTQAANLMRAATVFLFTLLAILIGLTAANLIDTKEKLKRTVIVLFLSAFLVTVFGLFQFAGDLSGLPPSITGLRDLYTKEVFGFPRVHSTALEPLYFANYLLIPLCLALSLLFGRSKKIKWFWLLMLIILGLTNFILALSRAAYIALVFSLIILLFFHFRNLFSLKRIIYALVVILAVYFLFVRIFHLTGDFSLYFEKFSTQVTGIFTGASYTDRADTINQAWALFKTHPYLGVGTGNFGPEVAWYALVTPEKGWLIVNNEFLEILTETGIFGLLAFFAWLAVLFIRSFQAVRRAKDAFLKAVMIGLSAAFIGVIIQYQTFSILYIIHVWFLFGLMMAVMNLIDQENSDKIKI
ncbi:MAG: O-antigen ligase family protein [Patescibacteria group bacterium]